jgi:hypothetical protein
MSADPLLTLWFVSRSVWFKALEMPFNFSLSNMEYYHQMNPNQNFPLFANKGQSHQNWKWLHHQQETLQRLPHSNKDLLQNLHLLDNKILSNARDTMQYIIILVLYPLLTIWLVSRRVWFKALEMCHSTSPWPICSIIIKWTQMRIFLLQIKANHTKTKSDCNISKEPYSMSLIATKNCYSISIC